jgi:hypothetical protein
MGTKVKCCIITFELITESLVNLTEGIAVFLLLGSDVFQVGLLQALVVIDVLSVSKFIT